MSRAVRNYQDVAHSGTFRFSGGVAELSPTAEPNTLAVYEGALFLSASLLGNTVWVPMARSGMTKVHDQQVPIYNWSIANPFNSVDLLVQVFDVDGYKYHPSIKVTPTEILIEHTAETAGRAMIISTGNLLTGFPDVVLDSEKGVAGGVATLDSSAKVPLHQLYLATVAQQGLVQLNDGLLSNSVTQALTANQGRVLKGLIDNINALLTSDDSTLDELQEVVDFIKLNRADLDALSIESISGLTAALATKVDVIAGKQLSTEDYTTAEKNKLAGVAPGAQVNVGTNLSYTQSTRELASSTGQNVALPLVTPALPGLMSEEDKTKLNGIAAGAQVNVGTNLSQGTRTATTVPVASSTGSAASLLGASSTLAGVMTAADKVKLDGVEPGAEVNVVDSVAGKTGAVTLVKADVGLGNVDNTSDVNKPVSTTQQTALNLKLNIASIVNNLTTGGAAVPLSAEQGKVLKGLIDNINALLTSDDSTLDELQEVVDFIKLNRADLDALSIASIAGLQAALDAKLNANHASVTNAREWTAGTVSQAEAETGTATTRRAWTAQRVFQAIAAWWAASAFKTKLDGIETGAQVNVGTNLTMGGSGNLRFINSSTGNSVTIPTSTPANAGFMGIADKTKLDGIQAGAQVNVGTDLTSSTTTTNVTINSSTGSNSLIPAASTSAAGVMTAADKVKLNGISADAQVNTVNSVAGKTGAVTLVKADVGLSNVTNTSDAAKPVSTAQQTALNAKVDKVTGRGLSQNDFTNTWMLKLDGIAAGAQVNVGTDLSIAQRMSNLIILRSSTGNTVELPVASYDYAGLFASADKMKLDVMSSKLTSGTAFDKYNVLNSSTTGAINLSTAQVWKLTDPGSARTVSITNPPAPSRSMSVVIKVIGNRATTWPAGIQWADGLAPVLAANWTFVILTYIDGTLHGSVGPSA